MTGRSPGFAIAAACRARVTAGHSIRDRGSGTLLALATAVTTMTVAAVSVPLLAVLAIRPSVLAAADAAALAAADTASGAVWGHPCERAARAATLVDASLTACSIEGHIATVTVTRPVFAFALTARSRAGPPASPGFADRSVDQ